MNRSFFNTILFSLLIITGLTFNAGAQNIRAEARLNPYTIRIGDQTRLYLIVHQPIKEHVNFPKLTDTITGKVQVVSSNKPDTVVDKNDRNQATITQSYTLTSFDAGTYTIPSYSFGTAGGVVKTNELTLMVQTVKVDTTKGIYDIKQPLKVSYTFFDWLMDNWYWVVLALVVIAAIIGLIYYLKKRPKNVPVIKVVKQPIIPAHVEALKKLNELRDKKLWQRGEVKQYYIELSDVLREYLEKRYLIKTHEKTTDEIFDSLKYLDIKTEDKQLLRKILVMADLVKFAKEKPLPAENEQSLANAISFVSDTQQVEVKSNAEGGNL
ncbi:MAG: protein BatD [Mucilaginibacter sp.]|nr:protein BatD [Mucilaginibacter sp.]